MSTAKPTFPNNPTWEQKCKAAWVENKRIEDERLVMAKRINELNGRLTIGDTSTAREARDRDVIRDLNRDLSASRHEANHLGKEAKVLRLDLDAARELIAEMNKAHHDTEPADDIDVDAEVDALTDLIRAAKKIRRRWRGE